MSRTTKQRTWAPLYNYYRPHVPGEVHLLKDNVETNTTLLTCTTHNMTLRDAYIPPIQYSLVCEQKGARARQTNAIGRKLTQTVFADRYCYTADGTSTNEVPHGIENRSKMQRSTT